MRLNPENETLSVIKGLETKIDRLTEQVAKIRRHLFWQRIFGTVKFILIVAPIIAGLLYLIPIFNELYSQYASLVGQTEALSEQAEALRKFLPVGF